MNPWHLLQSPPGMAHWNMAVDEALLQLAPALGTPVLRFYSWTEPAATFGYFQRYVEVEKLTALRPLIRRPTGGGIVPHDADWTYCLAFPAGHEWYQLKAVESYRRVHGWLQAAFAALGIQTEVAPASLRAAPGQCFAGHEQFDLLWHGRKIAGAAQRRTRHGLLIQGSVQPPSSRLARADWESSIRAAVPAVEVKWALLELKGDLAKRAEALAADRYATAWYNRKR